MTAQEIYDLTLYLLRDEEGKSSGSNALPARQFIPLLNEAINEACRRSRLITDRVTTAVCTIPVISGTAVYDVHPSIIRIRNARLVTANRTLTRTYVEDKDAVDAGWEDRTGTPDEYVADYGPLQIALSRTPIANDTLKLAVTRLPLTPVVEFEDTPEIKAQYHNALCQYLIYKVRSLDDTETYDARKADLALAEFEKEFGPKRSAWSEMYEASQPGYEAE